MAGLVAIKYSTVRNDMSRHVDRLAALIEKLRSIGIVFYNSLVIVILAASIEFSE